MSYYICRRTFRDASGPIPAGSIVGPAGIKRFRFRLQEGHIVEVNEQTFEKYASLFKQRYGIEIPTLEEAPVDDIVLDEPVVEEILPEEPAEEGQVIEETQPEPESEPEPEPVVEENLPEKPKPVRAKAVNKAK